MATNFDATRLAVQTAFPTNDLLFDDKEMPSIHVFSSRMCYDISTPFERTAVDRCCKCIIHNKRHTMCMCGICKFFQIQNNEGRIGDCLSKYCFCIFLKCCIQLFLRTLRIYKRSFYTHFFDRMGIQIVGTSVKSRCTDNMISRFHDIHNRIEISCLSG